MDSVLNSSGSTRSQRLSSLNTTRAGHSISRTLVDQTTFRCGTPTADGGNSSNMKAKTLLTCKTERYSMSMETEMLKDKTVLYGTDTMEPIKDGESSMLTQ